VDTIIYLIILKIKKIFDFKNNVIKSLSILGIFFLLIFYGYFLAQLTVLDVFRKFYIYEETSISIVILFLTIITFLRGIFPVYISLKNILLPTHPVNIYHKFFLNLVNEILTPFYLGIFVFCLSFSFSLKEPSLYLFFKMIICVGITHLLKRLIQILIECRIYVFNKTKLFVIVMLGFIIQAIVFWFEIYLYEVIFLLLNFSLLVIINMFIDHNPREGIIFTLKRINFLKSKWGYLILNNKILRVHFLICVFLKVFILTVFLIDLKNIDRGSESLEFIITFALLPAPIFLYYFNNIFGYTRTIIFTSLKADTSLIQFIKIKLNLILLPLVVDLLITIFFLNLFEEKFNFGILMYVNGFIVLFTVSVFSSIFFAKKINKVFTSGVNTSFIGNAISLCSVGVTLSLTHNFGIISLFMFLSFSVISLFLLNLLIERIVQRLYSRLFY